MSCVCLRDNSSRFAVENDDLCSLRSAIDSDKKIRHCLLRRFPPAGLCGSKHRFDHFHILNRILEWNRDRSVLPNGFRKKVALNSVLIAKRKVAQFVVEENTTPLV